MIKSAVNLKCILAGGFLLCCAMACNVTKKTTERADVSASQTDKPLDALDYTGQKLLYTSFSGKADLQIKTETQNQNLSLNLRMRKDKDIWASLLAMGILEAARAYITPDSLFGLDRLSKTAYVLSYTDGMQLIQADIPFPMLQNLIIGNPFIQEQTITNVEIKDSIVEITQQQGEFEQVLSYQKQSRLLQHLSLKSSRRNFSCELDYSDYRPLELKQPFPFSRDIRINQDGKKVSLHLNFSRAQIEVPVDMNFSIPPSYSRGSLKK